MRLKSTMVHSTTRGVASLRLPAQELTPCRSWSVSRPALALGRHPFHLRCSAAKEPLPPLVEQLLQTPGLEAPEGLTPEHMLRVTEAYWSAMRNPATAEKTPPVVMRAAEGPLPRGPPEFDVCIAGGTLGIFVALALQQRGHKVCVVEKRLLQGRTQEWNISRAELDTLIETGLLTEQEVDSCITTAWDADRIQFKGAEALWVSGVLNIGVSPRALIAAMRRRFLEAGGTLLEHTAFKAGAVHSDGVEVQLLPSGGSSVSADEFTMTDVNRPSAVARSTATTSAHSNGNGNGRAHPPRRQLSARLFVDCMGHYSTIVKQIRGRQKPDGMVVVVGGCMEGVPPGKNETADLLHTFTDAADDAQYLWEAFPADGGSARTAYMFLYSDDKPERPNFTALLDTYLHLLPKYQGVPLSQIKFKRILFGGFPCYVRGSPLPPAFDRVLQIGDAAAGQSPLSFGGFGSMARHLPRLTRGLDQSLREDRLRRQQLGWLQPYQPSLSLAWLFQRSMSIKVGQLRRDVPAASSASTSNGRGGGERGWLPVDHINRLMRCNFAVMKVLGDRVLRPFVQDAIQLGPLMLTMLGMSLRDPVAVTRVLFQVGPGMILGWFKHYVALAAYTVMFWALRPLRGVIKAYAFQRLVDALEYGSSSDYRYAPPAAGEAAAASGARVGDQRVPEGAWLANGGAPEGHRQPAGVLQM